MNAEKGSHINPVSIPTDIGSDVRSTRKNGIAIEEDCKRLANRQQKVFVKDVFWTVTPKQIFIGKFRYKKCKVEDRAKSNEDAHAFRKFTGECESADSNRGPSNCVCNWCGQEVSLLKFGELIV